MNKKIILFINKFKVELQIRKYSPRTVEHYCDYAKKYFAWYGQDSGKITLASVKSYLHYLFMKNLSANTIALHISALKSFIKIVFKSSLLDEIKLPGKNKTLPYILSREEVIKILKSITNAKHRTMIAFLYGSGLRVSEVINIKVKDLDPDKKRVTIRKGKGRKDRNVIISKQIMPVLLKYMQNKKKNDYIFTTNLNNIYSVRTVQQIFSKALHKSEIQKHSTCHTLRHSFATHLLENGNNIVDIQKLLGHKSVKTTMIYTKLAKSKLDDIDSPLDVE